MEKKSVQKLRGTVKARLKTFLQLSSKESKPTLDYLKHQVALKRAKVDTKLEEVKKRSELIEEFQVSIG